MIFVSRFRFRFCKTRNHSCARKKAKETAKEQSKTDKSVRSEEAPRPDDAAARPGRGTAEPRRRLSVFFVFFFVVKVLVAVSADDDAVEPGDPAHPRRREQGAPDLEPLPVFEVSEF